MRTQDIIIGESYRFKAHPNFGWAKALKVLKAKQEENTTTFTLVKCEHTVEKNDTFDYIRYFRPAVLQKG